MSDWTTDLDDMVKQCEAMELASTAGRVNGTLPPQRRRPSPMGHCLSAWAARTMSAHMNPETAAQEAGTTRWTLMQAIKARRLRATRGNRNQ
jgi:hypothetical protein